MYLKGDGSAANPWIIHNAAALKYFFEIGSEVSGLACLVTDIDMTGVTVNVGKEIRCFAKLNGNGFAIKDMLVTGDYRFHLRSTFSKISWVRLRSETTADIFTGFNSSSSFVEDCTFHDVALSSNTCYSVFIRCIVTGGRGVVPNYYSANNCFLVGHGLTFSKFTDLRADEDRFNPANYSAMTALPALWIVDGFGPPRLIRQEISHLVQVYAVKGNVKVGGAAKARYVMALSVADFYKIGDAVANNDGAFMVACGFYSDAVMVATYEPYGSLPALNKAYVLGNIIHPATPNGFRYLCTKAGNSGATLPPEPWSTSAALTIGAAIFTPDPVYQPQLHGPIKPVLVDLITGQPV